MLPEDLPLTAGELARLFEAAGLKTHQEIASAMGVGRSTVTKWLSGSLKLSPEAAARVRKVEPSPGAEVTWNTYLAGIPATISAFKERIASSEPKLPPGPVPEIDPRAIAENLAPLLHVPRIEVVAQLPKQETGDLAREVARALAEQLAHQAFKIVGTAQEEADRLVAAARLALREALWNRARRILREARQRARSTVQEAQRTARGIVQEAHRDAERITRQARWKVGKGFLQTVALMFGVLALSNVPWARIIPPREAAPSAANATHAPQQVAEQVSGMMPPQVRGIMFSILGGLKMPETPDPAWHRPGKDGKCRNPVTGEQLRAVVLRGSCWGTVARMGTTCADNLYDPPPEVLKDPKLKPLHEMCFAPYARNGNTITP